MDLSPNKPANKDIFITVDGSIPDVNKSGQFTIDGKTLITEPEDIHLNVAGEASIDDLKLLKPA